MSIDKLTLAKECFYFLQGSSVPHWRSRPASHFRGGEMHAKAFNTRHAGTPVGHVRSEDARRRILVSHQGVRYSMYGYQVVWALSRNEWPATDIDHKDVNAGNDSAENLRIATRQQNLGNTMLSAHNTSGFKGVGWKADKNKWRACIKINGKNKFLGYFDLIEDASSAYMAAAKQHFGEFARAK